MAKYRKIDPKIWNDQKFMSLSDLAKLAFFFILTHPNMTMIGAMRASLNGLADEIRWDPKAFREAFREALNKGMVEHDESACLIWLPKFLKYNQPESPNVVKSWVNALDLLPECHLLNSVISECYSFLSSLDKAFVKALPEAFEKALAKPFGKPCLNQEQEQEQEQELDQKQDQTLKNINIKQVNNNTNARARSEAKSMQGKSGAKQPRLAERPHCVDEEVWESFALLRKHKKAPLTLTAIQQIEKEAQKAKWPLEKALAECCARGWQSFKADWVLTNGNQNGRNYQESSTERLARRLREATDNTENTSTKFDGNTWDGEFQEVFGSDERLLRG